MSVSPRGCSACCVDYDTHVTHREDLRGPSFPADQRPEVDIVSKGIEWNLSGSLDLLDRILRLLSEDAGFRVQMVEDMPEHLQPSIHKILDATKAL